MTTTYTVKNVIQIIKKFQDNESTAINIFGIYNNSY